MLLLFIQEMLERERAAKLMASMCIINDDKTKESASVSPKISRDEMCWKSESQLEANYSTGNETFILYRTSTILARLTHKDAEYIRHGIELYECE